jgi:hypothetical protein
MVFSLRACRLAQHLDLEARGVLRHGLLQDAILDRALKDLAPDFFFSRVEKGAPCYRDYRTMRNSRRDVTSARPAWPTTTSIR